MQPTRLVLSLRRLRLALWLVLPVAAIGALGVYLWTDGQRPLTSNESVRALISGKFSLVDHDGRAVTDGAYKGRWRLMFFGYTHCPDVCPTTLNTMAEVMGELGDDAKKVLPLFISIDPERDKPSALKEYVSAFHPRMIGLSGSAKQIRDAAKAFRVYYGKAKDTGDTESYLMDHSAVVYLMDTQGKFATMFSHGADTKTIVSEIRRRL